MLMAARHVPTSDFMVLIAVPIATVAAGSETLWGLMSFGGLAVLAGALIVSAVLARRIARPITELSRTAAELATGGPISPSPPSPVAEVAAVREALVRAAEALHERAAEREQLIAAETAQVEAERRTQSIERISREKDEFLAMLSHELRNPLGAIASANAVLGQVGNAEPQAGRARAIISRQVQHLVDIVDDLLDVSRVTMGKIVLTCRPVDLVEVVRRCLESLETDGRTSAHDVSFDGRSVWVDGDETRLEQIVGNLMTNALKYTPAGGRIRVSVGPEYGDAVFRVQDTGIGIPTERLPQIFDLFFQGERTLDRSRGGLGVGLTLVKRLTELHGGRVTAASDGVNQGSTFTVHLPAGAPVRSETQRADHGGGAGQRIVIIEDNTDAREMLKTALELAGHLVWDAEDGPGGIEEVRIRKPDAVVIDIGLPALDGYEVGRRLRELPGGRALRLIALTGYGQAVDRQRSADAGFDAHLLKPVDLAHLQRVIRPRHRERIVRLSASEEDMNSASNGFTP
jgi:signal transduction histidine kinase/ActR/RegA family two-component response regulator